MKISTGRYYKYTLSSSSKTQLGFAECDEYGTVRLELYCIVLLVYCRHVSHAFYCYYYVRAMAGKVVVKIGEAVTPPIVAAAICFGSNDANPVAPNSMSFKMTVVEINCDWMVPICVWIAKIDAFEREPAMRPIRMNQVWAPISDLSKFEMRPLDHAKFKIVRAGCPMCEPASSPQDGWNCEYARLCWIYKTQYSEDYSLMLFY
jgi:hypothetical protein